MSEEELKGHGVEELELLLARYGLEQTHKWTEDKEGSEPHPRPSQEQFDHTHTHTD